MPSGDARFTFLSNYCAAGTTGKTALAYDASLLLLAINSLSETCYLRKVF